MRTSSGKEGIVSESGVQKEIGGGQWEGEEGTGSVRGSSEAEQAPNSFLVWGSQLH